METKQRSSQRFCRCGHARSLTQFGLRHVCGVSSCECVKHDTAVTPKKAKLTVVEAPIAVDIDPWQFWLSIRRCQSEAEAESMIRSRDAALTLAAMEVNAMARDSAVALLEVALTYILDGDASREVSAAIDALAVIS